jgi:uncharacterized protein with FMN-binding domain
VRIRAIAAATLASVSVIGLGMQIGQPIVVAHQAQADAAAAASAAAAQSATPPSATATESGAAAAPSTAAAAPTAAAPPATTTGITGTWTGSVVATRFGNVQVAVTIDQGVVTDVTALQLTDADPKSVQISNRAAPVLRQEVLAAQSTAVYNVTGATYTTNGYLTSLQAALDDAGF